jgi:hypothetical protein
MRSLKTVAFTGLCILAACSQDKPDACDLGQDTYRCKANELQWCLGGCFFGSCVAPTWGTMETCKAPEVCKIGTNPELAPIDQTGCFEANSSCAEEGAARCALSDVNNVTVPGDLWTCSRSSQNQSLQWTLTRCDLQTPAALCLGDPPPAACYEVAGTCSSSPHAHLCEGNVLNFCSGPTIVDGKAVFDWILVVDCAATGMVCRNGDCANP